MRCGSSLTTALAFLALSAAAHAQTPAVLCSRIGTDDTLRPIPIELVSAVNALFGTQLPARVVTASSVFRCASGRVFVCTTGANLPCGKVDTSRTPGIGAVQWCRDHPSAAFVPAAATGHDTLYQWECRSGRPEIARQISEVDSRGFVAQYWRELK